MFWCCTWTSLHSSFLLFLFKVVVCLLQQLDFPGWQLCWTILFLAVGGLSRAVFFLWGSDVGVENSKWWQFPKWWKEMDSSLQGSMCALGRCAEVPPCSPISLRSSRFRSRAPFGGLGSQMDQTHTHRGVMLTLSQDVCGPWWIRLFIGWTASDFHPEHSSAYLGTFHLVHRGDTSTPDFPLGIPPEISLSCPPSCHGSQQTFGSKRQIY